MRKPQQTTTEESAVSLRDYVDTRLLAIEKNIILIEEQRKLLLGMVHIESDLLAKSVETRFLAIDKATALAAAAVDKRLESMNEFRAQIADLQGTFIPRLETMALFKSVEDKMETQRVVNEKNIDEVTKALSDIRLAMTHLLAIDAYEARHVELQRQVNDLRESRSERSGRALGANALWGYLVAVASIALALIFHFVK